MAYPKAAKLPFFRTDLGCQARVVSPKHPHCLGKLRGDRRLFLQARNDEPRLPIKALSQGITHSLLQKSLEEFKKMSNNYSYGYARYGF